MSAPRRVLMISYYFPPLGGIASLRAMRFASQLPGFGWEPTVVAPRRGAFHEDHTLLFPEERVIRTAALAPGVKRTALRSGKVVLPSASGGGGRLRALVRRWVFRPDAQIGWYPFALAAARRALRDTRHDAIFSSSVPVTAHLVARRLHLETGLPWVADFRDLWTDWGRDSPGRLRRDQATETAILTAASAVTTVSQTYAEVLRGRGARRVEVLTNAFDPENFEEDETARDSAVAYLGTFYPGIQDLGTALAALGQLALERPALRVVFIGEFPSPLARNVEAAGLAAAVRATGFVSHTESIRQLRRARVLLLAGPLTSAAPEHRGHIAAKTFEYLAAERPILVVGDAESDVVRMLRPYARVRVVAPGDVAAAREAIRALLDGPISLAGPPLEAFTSRALTGRLAALLASLKA